MRVITDEGGYIWQLQRLLIRNILFRNWNFFMVKWNPYRKCRSGWNGEGIRFNTNFVEISRKIGENKKEHKKEHKKGWE